MIKIKVYEYDIWGDEENYSTAGMYVKTILGTEADKASIQWAIDNFLNENLADGITLDDVILSGEIEAGEIIYAEAGENRPVCEFWLPERVPSPFKRKEVSKDVDQV